MLSLSRCANHLHPFPPVVGFLSAGAASSSPQEHLGWQSGECFGPAKDFVDENKIKHILAAFAQLRKMKMLMTFCSVGIGQYLVSKYI